MYKNTKGENYYTFGWLTSSPNTDSFSPTTGGNSTWAKTKKEAIRKVNDGRKEWEAQYSTYWKLRVNPFTVRRVKNIEESRNWNNSLWSLGN